VNFVRGADDIGYGLRPEDPREQKAKNSKTPDTMTPTSFDEYAKFVSEYTAEKVSKLSGVPSATSLRSRSSTPIRRSR